MRSSVKRDLLEWYLSTSPYCTTTWVGSYAGLGRYVGDFKAIISFVLYYSFETSTSRIYILFIVDVTGRIGGRVKRFSRHSRFGFYCDVIESKLDAALD